MMSAIANEIKRNPEYLSILEKEAEKNGIIDDKIQKEQVSALQILLSETLRRSNYKGSEIQMVLTDVTDPVGPYYTDTKTNTIVFDRKTLAKSDKVQLIKDLAHEFGHYSKADDNPKSQDVAIFSENLIEKKIQGIESKEASESLLERVRNNENVLIGEVAKIRANRIPLEDREYVKWGRVAKGVGVALLGGARTLVGVGEVTLGVGSSSLGVGVVVTGHGVAQTGFGLSETVEGLDHIRLGFIDISEEEREALSLSKKLLGKYEEALNFAVGGTTSEVATIGQAYGRVPKSYPKVEHTKESQGKNQKGIIVSSDSPNETSNKTTINKVNKNSDEIVLYKEKEVKVSVDIKSISDSPNRIEGYNYIDIKNMTIKDFKQLGEKLLESPHKGRARFLKGTDKEAREIFYARTTRVENISNKKGAILKGVDKYGNKIVYRNFSTVEKSYPTIDVYETINGDEKKVIELKFRE